MPVHLLHHAAPDIVFFAVQLLGLRGVDGGGASEHSPWWRCVGRRCCRRQAAAIAASGTLLRGDRAERRHAAEILAALDFDDHRIV